MSDLISRQAAIDEIKALYEWHDTVTEDRTIDHLKRLPSAEPDVPDINVGDMISRQNLMEKLNEICDKSCPYNEPTKAIGACCSSCFIDDVIEIVQNLPSAEPEIIYCGDCKYKDDGIDEDGIPFLKCLNGRSYGGTRINDYCSWAERRTDE